MTDYKEEIPAEGLVMTMGKALMMIAGSDKEITEPEMDWLENNWIESQEDSEGLFDILVRFNYREESLANILEDLKGMISSESIARDFIYSAINMASADQIYSKEEKESVREAAGQLGLKDELVSAIESLVEMETAVAVTKAALLNT